MKTNDIRSCLQAIEYIKESAPWFSHRHFLIETRASCLDCVRKHLSQAEVLMDEAKLGYPEHKWLAVGHLAEASSESLKEYPALSEEIRKHRIAYMKDDDYAVPILDLIKKASALAAKK